jgi:hypothetical protein
MRKEIITCDVCGEEFNRTKAGEIKEHYNISGRGSKISDSFRSNITIPDCCGKCYFKITNYILNLIKNKGEENV